MGWKTSLVLFEGRHPAGDAALLESLGYGAVESVGESTVDACFHPESLSVAHHGDLTILFDPDLPMRLLAGDPALDTRLVAAGPFPRILVAALHSVTNFFAYAWYEGGVLRRRVMGAGDDGSYEEDGAPQPFEARVFERYRRETEPDGTIVFVDELDRHTIDALGEELVFEAMAELLGMRPDGPGTEAFFAAKTTMFVAVSTRRGWLDRVRRWFRGD